MWKFAVVDASDVYAPRHAARDVGHRLGFSRTACHELAIVVSELTSNILKYGVRGSITIEGVDDVTRGPGMLVLAHDVGPPFRNFELALQDGYDDLGPIDPASVLRRGGIGAGLGAILRLSDSLQVEQSPGGKTIRVVRYVTRPRR